MSTLLKINDDPMGDTTIKHTDVIQIDHYKNKSEINFAKEAGFLVSHLKEICSKELFNTIKNEFKSDEVHEKRTWFWSAVIYNDGIKKAYRCGKFESNGSSKDIFQICINNIISLEKYSGDLIREESEIHLIALNHLD